MPCMLAGLSGGLGEIQKVDKLTNRVHSNIL
jgi:hypothetical protein